MENKLTLLSANELLHYTSQIKLCEIGLSGQEKLKSSSIAVVGAGGLGCACLLYLASSGIGRLGIIDHDTIEVSNLQRQVLYHYEDIGLLKCEAAKKKLSLINPHVELESNPTFLNSENAKKILQNFDVIIDATDNFPSRYVINDICLEISKPFIYGSIQHFEGQVAIFNAIDPNGILGPDYRSLFPHPPDPMDSPTCSEGGVIGPLPGIIGSIQALEAIKLILQIGKTLSGKLLKVDSLNWVYRLYQIGNRHEFEENPFEISTETIQQMILEKVDLQLIDLRENCDPLFSNFEIMKMSISKLLEDPLKIPDDKVIIVFCQSGSRSNLAVKIFRERFNYQKMYSLKGGIRNLTPIEKKNDAQDHSLGQNCIQHPL